MKKRILLVDDNEEFVTSMKDVLEAHGFEVEVASDGTSGLEAAKRMRPDLMVLDVMMATETEGFDLSRDISRIKELSNMPVIILTGIRRALHLSFKFEPDDQWLPVKAVLEKPVSPEKLIQEINKHLG